jgi:trans-aconitate 2-methyltransferase
MPWNPDVYLKFQTERFAPFEDLLMLVNRRERVRVIDLGCGTGEITRRLADHLSASEVVGIDSSAEMLERAKLHVRPGLTFEQREIENVSGKWDLVFSHAAIQWVDDHEMLVPKLFSLVADGGQLVVQLPSNQGHASHLIMRELAGVEPFHSALNGWSRTSHVLALARYAELLHNAGGLDLNVFEKVYLHVLRDSDEVVSWMTSTALIPYFEKLPADLHDEFLSQYRMRLRKLWHTGPVLFGFQRILFSATRRTAAVPE